jgi:acyl-coenzyme A thioesterase PaaI-like protein
MAKMLDGMEALLRGEVPPPAAATLLGMRLRSFSAGEALVELDATAAHGNPTGTVQGGVLAAVADAAMGWAYMTTLGEGEGLIECDRLDAGDKLVAHAVSTCMILRVAPSDGR